MKTQIIVALDGLTASEALDLAAKLAELDVVFKVNDLLDDSGPQIITDLSPFGRVMADPKFHDIPNTVANRVKKLVGRGPDYITVHASGTMAMMRAAVKNAGTSQILAVTVLTSLNEEECNLTFGNSVEAKVLYFARQAAIAHVHGIVCSPQELKFLAGFPELKTLIKVCPSIRMLGEEVKDDDQARKMTPGEAKLYGADFIVIGRPIVQAPDPYRAVLNIYNEIDKVG